MMERCWKGKLDVQDVRVLVKAKHLLLARGVANKKLQLQSDLQSVENSYNLNKRYFQYVNIKAFLGPPPLVSIIVIAQLS